ncbi:MAG: ABC transporter ATP-binding protein [Kamptonema sp. SIO4C4]|nr:ABC transporter ATP-binding protein [Kamptonema sp. SIO4C4]
MASLRHLLTPYTPYRNRAYASIIASSCFEITDLIVPYSIGQILNVLSGQSLDRTSQFLITQTANLLHLPITQTLSLSVLVGLVFLVTVLKAPIQPWLGVWNHWVIALKARRDSSEQVMRKILTLPLGFYESQIRALGKGPPTDLEISKSKTDRNPKQIGPLRQCKADLKPFSGKSFRGFSS